MTASPGRRRRYCGKCVSGEHDLGVGTWETEHCRLQREGCQCDCDCPYFRVLIEEPRCLPGSRGTRSPRRRWSAKRSGKRLLEQYVHHAIGPPDLTPEEYLKS